LYRRKDGQIVPDFYNELGAMHGTMMIFAGIVPVGFAAFGNFVVPLQIGAHRSVGFEVGLAEWAKEEPFGLERDHRAEMYASARRAV
jgi:heme/copper-type cytochrome/quinol oxidase subunit 1